MSDPYLSEGKVRKGGKGTKPSHPPPADPPGGQRPARPGYNPPPPVEQRPPPPKPAASEPLYPHARHWSRSLPTLPGLYISRPIACGLYYETRILNLGGNLFEVEHSSGVLGPIRENYIWYGPIQDPAVPIPDSPQTLWPDGKGGYIMSPGELKS